MLALTITVILALLISFVCSMSEAALYSVPLSHVEHLRNSGSASGKSLARLRYNIERPIAAVLTLNTVANTAGASLAGAFAASVFGASVLPIFAALFTISILFLSEIIPKTLGVAYARTLAPIIARPLSFIVFITLPIIYLSNMVTRLITPVRQEAVATEADVHALVGLSRSAGAIKSFEALTIKNILELDRKRVREVMTPRMVIYSLPATATVSEAYADPDIMHHTRIPVYEGEDKENIVGLILRYNIAEAIIQGEKDKPVGELMQPAKFVPETMPLDKLLVDFLDRRSHLFVVIDEYGSLSGVISLEDILEEILGREIIDESDKVQDFQRFAKQQQHELYSGKKKGVL